MRGGNENAINRGPGKDSPVYISRNFHGKMGLAWEILAGDLALDSQRVQIRLNILKKRESGDPGGVLNFVKIIL